MGGRETRARRDAHGGEGAEKYRIRGGTRDGGGASGREGERVERGDGERETAEAAAEARRRRRRRRRSLRRSASGGGYFFGDDEEEEDGEDEDEDEDEDDASSTTTTTSAASERGDVRASVFEHLPNVFPGQKVRALGPAKTDARGGDATSVGESERVRHRG